jgi:hypothetical protein
VVEDAITDRSWWDTVDALAAHGAGALVRSHGHLRTEMDRWLRSEHLWLRRSALLHQLRWRDATDADWLFEAGLTLAGERDFFIRKAIGCRCGSTPRPTVRRCRPSSPGTPTSCRPCPAREALLWLATHPG